MSTELTPGSVPEESAAESTPAVTVELIETIQQSYRAHQDTIYAIVGGAAAALIGALLWAVVTVGTGYQIGYMAIGVGLLVGFSVRFLGAGFDLHFGIIGAFFALLGCALGNLLSQVAYIANAEGTTYLETIGILNVSVIVLLFKESFQLMDILFYGIAIYEGYKFAFRPITDDEILAAQQGQIPPPPYTRLRIPSAIVLFIAISLTGYFILKASSIHRTFYYESGTKSYEGVLEHGIPEGEWLYYYESGSLESKGFFVDGKRDSVWESYNEAGVLLVSTRYRQGIKHGLSVEYHPNGKMQSSGVYRLGRQMGEWKFYYENEKLKQKGSYNLDLADGAWEQFYEDGTPLAKGAYKNNIPSGLWTYWNEKGVKTMETEHVDAETMLILNTWDNEGNPGIVKGNGVHNMLHSNGKIAEAGSIANGQRSGQWKKYYDDGTLQEEGEYQQGQYRMIASFFPDGQVQVKDGNGTYTRYFSDGSVSEAGVIENGKKTGTWKSFFPGDTLLMEENNYAKGKLHGTIKTYYDGVIVRMEGEMIEGVRNGNWNWYYSTSVLESDVHYENGKKEGKQKFYDEDGNIIRWEEYSNGEMIDSQIGKPGS